MTRRFTFLAVLIACGVSACSFFGDGPAETREPWAFEELPRESFPPCLSHADVEIVIDDEEDYERVRRRYAPQGEYVKFPADGVEKTFQLPYQPLDTDHDGEIGPRDVIIYVRDGVLVSSGGEEVASVSPIHVEGDSVLIFRSSPPYTVERKIHYAELFTVDPENGAVTFANPPPQGSTVSLSAPNKLYASYAGRACSVNYLDLADHVAIGKSISGNGCLQGLEFDLYLDRVDRKLIYRWRRLEDTETGVCTDNYVQIVKWIVAPQPPDGYEVAFVEDE